MARMRFPQTVPARGFYYIEQRTHLRISGESLTDLTDKVVEHRKYKGLPRASKEEARLDIERQTCTRLSNRECVSEGTQDEWKPVKDRVLPKLSEVMAFSRAGIEWVGGGRELVDKGEADRRAEICMGCSLNHALVGCRCSSFYKMLNRVMPAERKRAELGVCGACSCSLNLKVNMPMNVIDAADKGRDIQYPAHCWLKSPQ